MRSPHGEQAALARYRCLLHSGGRSGESCRRRRAKGQGAGKVQDHSCAEAVRTIPGFHPPITYGKRGGGKRLASGLYAAGTECGHFAEARRWASACIRRRMNPGGVTRSRFSSPEGESPWTSGCAGRSGGVRRKPVRHGGDRGVDMPGAEQGRDARKGSGTSSPSRRCAPISTSAAGPSTSGGQRTGHPGASRCRTAACASAGLSTSAGWPPARKLPDERGHDLRRPGLPDRGL